jgi:hypothetical protein
MSATPTAPASRPSQRARVASASAVGLLLIAALAYALRPTNERAVERRAVPANARMTVDSNESRSSQNFRAAATSLVSVAPAAKAGSELGLQPAVADVPATIPRAMELEGLSGRLPGERLTLTGRERSLVSIQRLLARSVDSTQRAALEQRRTLLQAKHDEQARRVAQIEERIAELQRP